MWLNYKPNGCSGKSSKSISYVGFSGATHTCFKYNGQGPETDEGLAGYSGSGLQFSPTTWSSNGGKGRPEDAGREEQIAVAERVLQTQGRNAWPNC